MASAALQTTSAQQRAVDITARLHELVYDLSGVGLSTLSLSPGTRGPNEALTRAIDAAIAVVSSAHSMLSWLQRTRNSLEASIYRLPDEVLGQIIREADGESKNYGLRLVSARWRDVVDCIPTYWTTIRPSKMKIEFQRLCLNRSTSWPLHLELKYPISSDEPSLAHAHRWKSLRLSIEDNYIKERLSDPLLPCHLPSLESFRLEAAGESLLEPSEDFKPIDDLPRLTHIHLDNVFSPLVGETTLARLRGLSLFLDDFHTPDPSILLDMLGSCTHLQQLVLAISYLEEGVLPTQTNPVVLPHLTELKFDNGCAPDWFPILLNYTTIPDSFSMAAEVWHEAFCEESASMVALMGRVKEGVSDILMKVRSAGTLAREEFDFRNSSGKTLLYLKVKSFNEQPEEGGIGPFLRDTMEFPPVKHATIESKARNGGLSGDYIRMMTKDHSGIESIELYCDCANDGHEFLTWDYAGNGWLFPNLKVLCIVHVGEAKVLYDDIYHVLADRVKGARNGEVTSLHTLTLVGMEFDRADEFELKGMVPNVQLR